MRNPQDTKNLLLLNRYVSRHFGLTSKSKRLFRERVLYNPDKAPEYMSIVGNSPDLRARFPVSADVLEGFDRGWDMFKNHFGAFVRDHGMTYTNFVNNKITIRKNEVKIFKAVANYFKDDRLGMIFPTFKSYSRIDLSKKILDYLNEKYGPTEPFTYNWGEEKERQIVSVNNWSSVEIQVAYYSSDKEGNEECLGSFVEDCYAFNIENIKIKEILTKEEIDLAVKNILTYLFDSIGAQAFPKKDLELVISCNPADMFMASTSEKWGSCINLDSDYPEAYWAGLPGAIIDKNRAIAYITDGEKKEYKGIVVDRFIARTWLLTMRTKAALSEKRKDYIKVVREYPFACNFKDSLASLLPDLNFNSEEEHSGRFKVISKYKFEVLYHHYDGLVKKLCYIYLDNTLIKFAKKGKTAYFPYDYAYHKIAGGDYPDITVSLGLNSYTKNSGIMFNEEGGLSQVIEDDYSISAYEQESEDDWEDEDEDEEEVW